ncbi:hypothetical protein CapIbe_017540 [Capra ibex]
MHKGRQREPGAPANSHVFCRHSILQSTNEAGRGRGLECRAQKHHLDPGAKFTAVLEASSSTSPLENEARTE